MKNLQNLWKTFWQKRVMAFDGTYRIWKGSVWYYGWKAFKHLQLINLCLYLCVAWVTSGLSKVPFKRLLIYLPKIHGTSVVTHKFSEVLGISNHLWLEEISGIPTEQQPLFCKRCKMGNDRPPIGGFEVFFWWFLVGQNRLLVALNGKILSILVCFNGSNWVFTSLYRAFDLSSRRL